MSLKIFKYSIQPGLNELDIPEHGKILSVGFQEGQGIQVWVLILPDKEPKKRHIGLYGTGWEIKEWLNKEIFIGTVMVGPLVFHAFDLG